MPNGRTRSPAPRSPIADASPPSSFATGPELITGLPKCLRHHALAMPQHRATLGGAGAIEREGARSQPSTRGPGRGTSSAAVRALVSAALLSPRAWLWPRSARGSPAPCRGAALRLQPAPRQRLAQQHLDLGVHAAQLGTGEPVHRIIKRRIKTQEKSFLGRHWRRVSRAILR